VFAVEAVELRGFAGAVAQGGENGLCGSDQSVLADGCGELEKAGAEREGAGVVAADEVVVFEGEQESVRRGSGEVGGVDHLCEGGGSVFERGQDGGCLVDHAHATAICHMAILAVRIVRRRPGGGEAEGGGRVMRSGGSPATEQNERTRSAPARTAVRYYCPCIGITISICETPCLSARRTDIVRDDVRKASARAARGGTMGTTLAEKLWQDHLVRKGEDGAPDLIYIDLHMCHEVTSPQAFEGLRLAGRPVRRPDLTIATEDHNTPTLNIDLPIADETSRIQINTLRKNAEEFGIRIHSLGDADQGVVHVVGPQLGLTMPGMTVVCGDSHTSTHGAFGALAFGIGTSEVEHVLATQTLPLKPFKTMAINVNGELPKGTTAKDIILAIIAKIGTGGGQGYVLEYRGDAIRKLSMEARMTICNMSIEAGARAGLIAPDETTFEFVKGRPHAPEGKDWDDAVAYWKTLVTDPDAVFDTQVDLNASDLEPFVTWGTNPGQGLPLSASVPNPDDFADETDRVAAQNALQYMGLTPGTPLREIQIDTVFLGSCTNGRIEDLRAAANIIKGRTKAPNTRMLVVPGSARVRLQAEAEGLDKIFLDFGAEWRNAGCSMCLGMNPDQLKPQERSASTSNRNFEGRQGKGGRTHLVSPLVAAATAVRGTLSSPDDLDNATAALA